MTVPARDATNLIVHTIVIVRTTTGLSIIEKDTVEAVTMAGAITEAGAANLHSGFTVFSKWTRMPQAC